MKNIQFLLMLLAFVFVANSCTKFEDLEADPNRSTSASPSLVLRGVLKDAYYSPWIDEAQWNQYFCVNYNYYGTNEYWTGPASFRYTTLKNVVKMEEEARTINLPEVNAYSALGKYLRAYFFYNMTMRMGDIPMSEALKGAENVYPKYDEQKAVFKQILTWLEEANNDLATRIAAADNTLQGDIYYNGDLRAWQKAVNAFKLRVLVQMSKKTDADLNVAGEFAKILGDPGKYPLFSSNADDLAFKYNAVSDKYPTNPDNFGFDALRNNMSATNIGLMTTLKDPRVFEIAEPGTYYTDTLGLSRTDFAAYVGAPFDEGLDAMSSKAQGGLYALIGRKRYYAGYNAEPGVQVGYAEMCFNIAEGINRGWAAGNAGDWYAKGITASMNFFGISDAAAITAYIAQPLVSYKGGTDGLKQILEQRYIALFQQAGLESYFHYRRTGAPTFAFGGPGTGNSGLIPRRFQYPTSERDNNSANYNSALTRQFGNTNDNVNDELWITKN